MVFAIEVGTGSQRGVSYSSQSGRQGNGQSEPMCLGGKEQAAVGALRRSIREAFPEEVAPEACRLSRSWLGDGQKSKGKFGRIC